MRIVVENTDNTNKNFRTPTAKCRNQLIVNCITTWIPFFHCLRFEKMAMIVQGGGPTMNIYGRPYVPVNPCCLCCCTPCEISRHEGCSGNTWLWGCLWFWTDGWAGLCAMCCYQPPPPANQGQMAVVAGVAPVQTQQPTVINIQN